jgi:hypothetical protein
MERRIYELKLDSRRRSLRDRMDSVAVAICAAFALAIVFVPFVVHVVVTVKANWAAMLIIGLIIPPVGWVHGVGVIFGFW